uniref:Carboxypeptidase n=1 Tax=Ganoderma boninense TaxID=34458 RepID=A0A5K1JY58_9APHY|nr:Uncharacterized protein [Ganoderma boninense]
MPAALRLLIGALWLSATGVSARFSANTEVDHRRDFAESVQPRQPDEGASDTRQSLITFADPRAKAFEVDGKKIPDVHWDAGRSWAGLMPISGDANETRKLFFWYVSFVACSAGLLYATVTVAYYGRFWPTTDPESLKNLVFWTNGGPGCSSLEGFLQENGPISWSWGQAEPTPNPWSWTQLSNMLWVEQPVGTGFSQGEPTINDDNALAAQVAGFLEQFLDIFSELKGSNFWVTGESYAGFFVPYIANYLYENPSPDLQLKGIWMADPSLTWDLVHQSIPSLGFVQANRNVFPFNSTFMAQLQNMSDACGFTDYFDRYVRYPPWGQLPFPVGATVDPVTRIVGECPRLAALDAEIHLLQPVSVERPLSPLPHHHPVSDEHSRTEVQTAINAPTMHWKTCNHAVYADPETGELSEVDPSVPSALSVLPNVIEKSERVVIVHGLAGFQSPIEEESFLVDDMGVFGHTHTERGLTYVEMFYSGHMAPQFVPWATYQTMAYVLGKRDSPSA